MVERISLLIMTWMRIIPDKKTYTIALLDIQAISQKITKSNKRSLFRRYQSIRTERARGAREEESEKVSAGTGGEGRKGRLRGERIGKKEGGGRIGGGGGCCKDE